ncbi:MAG: hypothetical protein AAB927_03690 [Patescibacteria group bacterium]
MRFQLELPAAFLTVSAYPWRHFLESRFPDGRALTRKVADAVGSRAERRVLLGNSAKVVDRIVQAAKDSGFSTRHIIQEIRGAKTSVGVVLDSGAKDFLPVPKAA